MGETAKPTPDLVEAQNNVENAEHFLTATTPLFIDRLLIATGGNVELVQDLIKDVANLAGQAGALAVAERRVDAVTYATKNTELHPDAMPPHQESGLYGNQGAQPIISAVDAVSERAAVVAKGASPVQKPAKEGPKPIEYNLDSELEKMINEVKGNHSRFINLTIQIGKSQKKHIEVRGDNSSVLEPVLKAIEEGKVRVVGRAIGTYTEDSKPPYGE